MRVDTRPRHRNSKRISEKSAPQFLAWLRGRNCYIKCCSFTCFGRVEAAHVDHGGDKGMGTKVSDKFAIPLCSEHHAEQHRTGWRSFQVNHQFDALAAAAEYWRQWPGRAAWERKLEQ